MMIIANFADYFMPASATARESGAEPDASNQSEQDFASLLAASFSPVSVPIPPEQAQPMAADSSLIRAETATAKSIDLSPVTIALPSATGGGVEISQQGTNFLPTSKEILAVQTTHSLAVGRESQVAARPAFSLAFLTQPNAESTITTEGRLAVPSGESEISVEKSVLPASSNIEAASPAKVADIVAGTSISEDDEASFTSVTSLPSATAVRVPADVTIRFETDGRTEPTTPEPIENLASPELSPLGLTAETVKIAASVVKSLVNVQQPETEALPVTNQGPEVDTIPATKISANAQAVKATEFAESEPTDTPMKAPLADSFPIPSLSSPQATSKPVASNEHAGAPTVATIDSAEPKQANLANPSTIPPLATAPTEPSPRSPQTTTQADNKGAPIQANVLPDNAPVQRAESAKIEVVTEQQKIAEPGSQVRQETLRKPIVNTEAKLAMMPKDQEVKSAPAATITSNEAKALAEIRPAAEQDATVAPAKAAEELLPDKAVKSSDATTKNFRAALTTPDSKSPLLPTVNLRPSHETASDSIAEVQTTATPAESSNEPILMGEESTAANSITPITANPLANAPTASNNHQPNEAQTIATQTIDPIIELAQTTPHRETRSLRISLNPEELGKIEVEVTRDAEGRLSAAFSAERIEAASSLTHSLGHLREMLEQAGLRVEHLEVTVTPQFQNSTGGQPGHQQQSQAQSSAPADFLPLSQTSENNPDSTEEEKLLNLRA